MHSRIFQISRNPIKKDCYLSEFDYEDHWFTYQIADYVSDTSDPERDYEWLNEVKGITVDAKKKTLTIDSKAEYFNGKYHEFTMLAKTLSEISLNEFITNEKNLDEYRMRQAYEDKVGFYVDDNSEYFGMATLDSFMRSQKVCEGDVFHLGAVIDYHF